MATTNLTWSLSPRQSKFIAAILSIAALIALNITPSNASRNGTVVADTPFSVGYTFSLSGIDQVCSGSLIAPTVIVTAAHCVVDEAGNKASNYIFAAPGTALDTRTNPAIKQPNVLKFFTVPGYTLTAANEKDDIAFIQLDMPLASKGFLRVATAAEVAALADQSELNGYGFGYVYETNAPYSIYTRKYSVLWNAKGTTNTIQISSLNAVACSGDSGGPITAKLASGEEVLVAAMSGAAAVVNRCGTALNGFYTMRVTLVNPYLNLVEAVLAAPTPTPSASATTSAKPVVKKYKITCVKGKVKKFVTGTNPKCPAGYKQTAKELVK